MRRIMMLLLLVVALGTLALVPNRGQTIGQVLRNASGPYWVAQVTPDSLVPGDLLSIRRNGKELAQASVVDVQGDQAMLRLSSKTTTPAVSDQLVWLSHGPAAVDTSAPKLVAKTSKPPRKPTPGKLVNKDSKGSGTAQQFSPPTFEPPPTPSTTFEGPAAPTTTFEPPTFQPPSNPSTTFQPPTASTTTFQGPAAPSVQPGTYGTSNLRNHPRPGISKLPQDTGMLDSRGQKVVFQHGGRVILGGQVWRMGNAPGLRKAVRDAQIGKPSTQKLGDLVVTTFPNRLVLRCKTLEAVFEGEKLDKLERVLANWK